jgi:hydroxyacylglutathione hydrolase
MLQLQGFTFNGFQENTYVIFNEKGQCWVVDPGMYDDAETEQLRKFIEHHGLVPQAIINTHTHLDHIFGVQALKDAYGIPFLMHERDLPVLSNAMASAMMFGIPLEAAPQADGSISEKEPLKLGEDSLEVRLAPGHSPGSIVFYYPAGKWVISGDVLFYQSIGRSDLPGGHHQTLLDSIHREMLTLPGDTQVFPGHGPATSIAFEKEHNPFLQ